MNVNECEWSCTQSEVSLSSSSKPKDDFSKLKCLSNNLHTNEEKGIIMNTDSNIELHYCSLNSIVLGLHFELEFIVPINYCARFCFHCEIVTGHGFEWWSVHRKSSTGCCSREIHHSCIVRKYQRSVCRVIILINELRTCVWTLRISFV